MTTHKVYLGRKYQVGALKYLPASHRGRVPCKLLLERAQLEFGEGELLYDMPRIMGSGFYCNLGHAKNGGSAFLMAQGLQDFELEGHVFSVDMFKEGYMRSRRLWKKSSLKSRLGLRRGTTDEWFEKFKQEDYKFQFVFIDAGHLYSNVYRDWFNYKTLVPVGGGVAFHDTNQNDSHKVLTEGPLIDSNWEEQKELHINRIRVFKRVG